jgi:hypothetical protein
MLRSAILGRRQVSSAANLPIRRRRTAGPEPEQRLKRGGGYSTTVMTEDKLVEIDLELTAAHAVMSAHKPLLEVADGAVGEGHNRLRARAELSGPRLLRGTWRNPFAGSPVNCFRPSV